MFYSNYKGHSQNQKLFSKIFSFSKDTYRMLFNNSLGAISIILLGYALYVRRKIVYTLTAHNYIYK